MYVRAGFNTLFYKAAQFKEGLAVTAEICHPDRTWHSVILEEFGRGIYKFDYEFSEDGKYLLLLSENGVKRMFEVAEWQTLGSSANQVRYIIEE